MASFCQLHKTKHDIKLFVDLRKLCVNCTNFFSFAFQIEVPGNFQKQGNCYSSYKHYCSLKVLIAVTPAGGASFISPPFEGGSSDRLSFRECGILNYVQPGDLFVGDRGFNVDDMLTQYGAEFLGPASGPTNENEPMSIEDERITKVIASARVDIFLIASYEPITNIILKKLLV